MKGVSGNISNVRHLVGQNIENFIVWKFSQREEIPKTKETISEIGKTIKRVSFTTISKRQ